MLARKSKICVVFFFAGYFGMNYNDRKNMRFDIKLCLFVRNIKSMFKGLIPEFLGKRIKNDEKLAF